MKTIIQRLSLALLLLLPASTTARIGDTTTNAEQPQPSLLASPSGGFGSGGGSNPEAIASGGELLEEMRRLHESLAAVQEMLLSSEIPADSEVMSKATKLFRRVRSLVYATNHELGRGESPKQRDVARRNRALIRANERRRARLEAKGLPAEDKTVQLGDIVERTLVEDEMAPRDDVQRRMFEETITFPECNEKLLEDCLEILSVQLATLQIEADIIIHEKRNSDQEGYNKVVIITDMTATKVKGKLSDGIVEYPFPWDDALLGYARMLGVNGQWDCHLLSPEDCCATIVESSPNPDTKGNYIQCHIFVPFGGVGNAKRDDRVFVNLSPDGRVHEPPIVA